ncbi:hypothetical protein E2C01_048522 [Portunus trituberculatus]|uniref:Uncharacterized protein n=1 Tax=Portunus trituberculatus TaxID=210409 RepID=A0A5B7GAF9_PORTR|nr:hypothetical protein [Portunus trituberculatus]
MLSVMSRRAKTDLRLASPRLASYSPRYGSMDGKVPGFELRVAQSGVRVRSLPVLVWQSRQILK